MSKINAKPNSMDREFGSKMRPTSAESNSLADFSLWGFWGSGHR